MGRTLALILVLLLITGCGQETADKVDGEVNKIKDKFNGTEENSTNTTEIVIPDYVPDKLRIGSFDIDGYSNDNNKPAMLNAYRNLIFDYDIIAIQNYKGDRELLYDLVYNLDMEFEERDIKDESMVFIYNKHYLRWKARRIYENNKFFRNPFGMNFEILGTNISFTIVQVHLNPTDATEEIKALEEVFEYFVKEFDNENIIIMGNMYAGCYYYNTQELEEYFWLIDEDTLTTSEECAYDRIITPEHMRADIADYGVHNYIRENDIDNDLKKVLSTHYPVYLLLSIN